MRGAVMYAPGNVRVEDRQSPALEAPTDVVIKVVAACVCGSDLHPYRGVEPVHGGTPMGHEYVGIVEQVGDAVRSITVGDFVVGSFMASDNTCEICAAGYRSRCVHGEFVGAGGAQSEYLRVPLADGTLVATPGPAQRGPDPVPARRLRRAGHGLVRCRCRGGRPRGDRRGGR